MVEESKIPYIKQAWIEVEEMGGCRYKIKDFWAESSVQLPSSYLSDCPKFYMIHHTVKENKKYLVVFVKPYLHYYIRPGDVLSEREFLQVLKAMREAGQRLTRIMKGKRKKAYKEMLKKFKNNSEQGTYRTGVGTYRVEI